METPLREVGTTDTSDGLSAAATWLRAAADAKKCWACGCLHDALDGLDRALADTPSLSPLAEVVVLARRNIEPQRYECLGCAECYPALALNALGATGSCGIDIAVCPTEPVEARAGWPPLPGSYRVLRYHSPVALCTLNSGELIDPIVAAQSDAIAIAGTLETENLGIERLITNILPNPFIRFLVVCGEDSRQAVGHLPGQSLIALARDGINDARRIVGAKGKRPVLRNLDPAAVSHFRTTVELVDLVGVSDIERITAAIRDCANRNPGVAEPFAGSRITAPIAGSVPERMISDPAGYFVIFLDRPRKLLSLEHYENNGVLTTIIEAKSAAEIYMTVIERKLLSQLDHAAYLGRELARAEHALSSGEAYIQDAAPERCSPECSCHRG